MPQIPMPPLRSKPDASTRKEGTSIKIGRFRRALNWLGAPAAVWVGTGSIRGSAAFTGEMVRQMQTKRLRGPRFHLAEDGRFDLAATAFAFGLSAVELEGRLRSKRRQTAIAAYLLGTLGSVLFLIWLVQVLLTPMTAGRLVLALEFLPACLMCSLLGFYQALVNFQIRTGRAASWRSFLATDHGFWPSK